MTRERPPPGRGKKSLPRLAFGNQNPQTDTSAKAMSERVQSAMPWEVDYQAIGSPNEFQHKLSAVNINGMRVVATASTPIEANIADARDASLMIPLSGHCVTTFDGRNYEWTADQTACLMPKVGRGGFGTERSALMLDLDPERLQQTWRAMAGDDASSLAQISLEAPQTLALNVGGVNFSDAYRHIGGLIDALNGDQQLLDKSGLDDLLYRLTVMLMRPKAFIDGDLASTSQVNAATLEQLCQYIVANLGKRITMTELEMLSGSSSRTLQYQFKHRFGCSPMRWVTQQRLDACRARFLSAQANESVTTVAIAYGFTNLGNFARMYAERFGELPSETLKNN